MANYNTGVTASLSNQPVSTAFTFTVPAGVLAGDVMIVSLCTFTFSGGTPAFSVPTSGGGSWTQVGTIVTGNQGAIVAYSTCWQRVATSADHSSAFTISFTGTNGTSNQYWWASDLESYTGFYTASPVGNFAQSANNQGASPVTCPPVNTARSGSWAIYCCPSAVAASGTINSGPAGTTQRHIINPGAGVDNAVFDSNGSAGAAGATIGGGSFALSSPTGNSAIAFTIELCTVAPLGPVEAPVPPQIPHPLWFELLEVAYERADWQAQGVATLAPFSWRLFDGVNGRPGTSSTGTQPPATATANGGNLTLGTSFYTSQAGMWFQGYWWFVCPSGGQPTGPQQFALWSVNGNLSPSGQVVPGSVVTSGTLSTGWNYVPLPQSVPLGLWSMYTAATGTTGPYPQTASQTNSGGLYSAGWSNGPVTAYSDLNGSNPPIYPGIIGNGSIQGGGTSNPAVTQPMGNANGGDLYWIDVQVTNVPAGGYQGSYRLWPNMYDADPSTTSDSSVNYVIGTEILFSQPSRVNAIWYYAPAGMGSSGNQWATSADMWNVRTGQRVCTNASPVWLNGWTNQVDGQSNSGRWVYCQMPGQPVLPAGDYYVSVYNGNGSPNGWGSKRFGYWELSPLGGIAPGYAPGTNGITTGPLYAPPTPLASTITDYNNTSVSAPGQSVFAVGPPNQVPNRYVGTPVAEFQNYWVDVEVVPATSLPAAPDLPQRIPTPLFWDLLEIAQYRADGATPPVPVVYAEILAAALLVTGSLTRQAGKALAAALAVTGVLARSVSWFLAAALTVTGSLAKQAPRNLAAAVSVAASIIRQPGKALGASAAVTGSLSRLAGKGLNATASAAGSLGRQCGKALSPGLTVTASAGRALSRTLSAGAALAVTLARQAGRTFSGSAMLTGTLATVKVRLLSLAASLAVTGSLGRQAGKALGAVVAVSGTLSRALARTLSAPAVAAGALYRQCARTLSGSAAGSASLTRQAGKPLDAPAGLTASLQRQPGKALAAAVTVAASLGRTAGKLLSAAASVTAAFFTGSGKVYQIALSAGVALSAAFTAAVSYLALVLSAGTAFFRWAAGTIRQRWRSGNPRNG